MNLYSILQKVEEIVDLNSHFSLLREKNLVVETYLGPKNSGKSRIAENRICKDNGRTCYVGTLPALPQYIERIIAHRERRPSNWQLLEWVGDFDCDENSFGCLSVKPDIVLVEGYSFFLSQALTFLHPLKKCADLSLHWLLKVLPDNTRVVIVDTLPYSASPTAFAKILWYVQAAFVLMSETSYIVFSGVAVPVRKLSSTLLCSKLIGEATGKQQ